MCKKVKLVLQPGDISVAAVQVQPLRTKAKKPYNINFFNFTDSLCVPNAGL